MLMETRDLNPEDEDVFETTPETPELVSDFVNAGLDYEPTADSIPSDELKVFNRPLLGADSLALRLFEEYKDGLISSDNAERFMLDLNIVPSPDSTDESNIIEVEYGDSYVISDAYARFRMRLVAIHETYPRPRGGVGIRYRIIHIGVRDKIDKHYGMELFLNRDDSVDAAFLINGRYKRRPATPEQQLIVAQMLDNLLNPGMHGDIDPDPDLQ